MAKIPRTFPASRVFRCRWLPAQARYHRRNRRVGFISLGRNEPVFVIPVSWINVAHQRRHASMQVGRIIAKENRLRSPEVRDWSENLSEHSGLMQPSAARGFYSRNKVAFAVRDISKGCPQTFHAAAYTAT
jgi:hypothetical protein